VRMIVGKGSEWANSEGIDTHLIDLIHEFHRDSEKWNTARMSGAVQVAVWGTVNEMLPEGVKYDAEEGVFFTETLHAGPSYTANAVDGIVRAACAAVVTNNRSLFLA
jgi:hypothetical protein